MEKFNVYEISPNPCYCGFALVAAKNAQEANGYIESFKDEDSNNECDSWGYSSVSETDQIEDVFSERKGILTYGICYGGW